MYVWHMQLRKARSKQECVHAIVNLVENVSRFSHDSSNMPQSAEYLTACDKGRSFVDALNSPEAANPVFPSLDSSYLLEEDELWRNVPKEMTAALAHFGIGFDHAEYVAAVPKVMEGEDPIYLNWFDPNNGVVIANMDDKRTDISPDDERLFPSEIIWQSWCRVTHRQSIPVSNLRVIVRLVVVNEASKKVIEETLLHSTCTREETTHFEYTEADQGFYALLGSINGASSMRMLIDHKEALGFRTVERVVVLGTGNTAENNIPSRTFMILLSSKRGVESDDQILGT